jgi:hypothetical protein
MTDEMNENYKNCSVVVAVTHDNARIWVMNISSSIPMMLIERKEPEHIHVRSAQVHHGHASENGEINYFTEIAHAIQDASSILLVGHGTGKANAAERFAYYLRDHEKKIAIKVASIETLNLPALSEGEIMNEAQRRWNVLTMRS